MDRLYIIGNGFDIDLGMDTRYSDFLGSTKFKEFAEDKLVTDFANYLLNQNREYWVDMETALKNYVNDNDSLDPISFKMVYDKIKVYLRTYIHMQQSKFIRSISEVNGNYGSSRAVMLIKKIKSEIKKSNNIKIINFNYTSDSFFRLYDNIERSGNQNQVEIINVHGTLEASSDIVLGVEDKALKADRSEFGYIKKGRDEKMANTNLYNSYSKASEISFFGHSLGESDIMHFKPMFEHIFNERKAHNVVLNFYNDGDVTHLNSRIDRLVDDNIGQFKGTSKLNFNPEIVF